MKMTVNVVTMATTPPLYFQIRYSLIEQYDGQANLRGGSASSP